MRVYDVTLVHQCAKILEGLRFMDYKLLMCLDFRLRRFGKLYVFGFYR
jgi:hypothetical protein